jgi:hypothetical protein
MDIALTPYAHGAYLLMAVAGVPILIFWYRQIYQVYRHGIERKNDLPNTTRHNGPLQYWSVLSILVLGASIVTYAVGLALYALLTNTMVR